MVQKEKENSKQKKKKQEKTKGRMAVRSHKHSKIFIKTPYFMFLMLT